MNAGAQHAGIVIDQGVAGVEMREQIGQASMRGSAGLDRSIDEQAAEIAGHDRDAGRSAPAAD